MQWKRMAALTVALIAAASTARAQPFAGDFTTRIGPTYVADGCMNGFLGDDGSGPVFGRAVCVRGSFVMGLAPTAWSPAWLAGGIGLGFYGGDRRLTQFNVPNGDSHVVIGTLFNARCPSGCRQVVPFPDFAVDRNVPFGEPGDVFVPQTLVVRVNYVASPQPSMAGRSFVTGEFALTAVPEPSTYALFATGLLGVVAIARRRARA